METMATALPIKTQQPVFEKMGGASELLHMIRNERSRYMKIKNFILRKSVLVAFFVFACVAEVCAEEVLINGVKYDLNESTCEATVMARHFKSESNYVLNSEYSGIVVIPETVTYKSVVYKVSAIADWAFYRSESLKTIKILSNYITEIPTDCFSCSKVKRIELPASIKKISNFGLMAENLEELDILAPVPPTIGKFSFLNFGSESPGLKIYVPNTTYLKARGWTTYASKMILPRLPSRKNQREDLILIRPIKQLTIVQTLP